MFNHNYVISIGQLVDVLDGKGTIAHVMKYEEVYDNRYELEMSIVLQVGSQMPTLKEHSGFIIPSIAYFDKPLVESLKNSSFKVKKTHRSKYIYTLKGYYNIP